MRKLKEAVAQAIKEYRKLEKLTQEQLAEKLNYSTKAVSQWEQCKTEVPTQVVIMLRDKLKKSIDEIYGLDPIFSGSTLKELDAEYEQTYLYRIPKEGVIRKEYYGDDPTVLVLLNLQSDVRDDMMIANGSRSFYIFMSNLADNPMQLMEITNSQIVLKYNEDFHWVYEFLLRKKLVAHTTYTITTDEYEYLGEPELMLKNKFVMDKKLVKMLIPEIEESIKYQMRRYESVNFDSIFFGDVTGVKRDVTEVEKNNIVAMVQKRHEENIEKNTRFLEKLKGLMEENEAI